MQLDPNKRIKIDNIQQDEWMSKIGPCLSEPLPNIDTAIKSFTVVTGMAKLVLELLLEHLSTSEVEQIYNLFKQADVEGDGYITRDEVTKVLRKSLSRESSLNILMHELRKVAYLFDIYIIYLKYKLLKSFSRKKYGNINLFWVNLFFFVTSMIIYLLSVILCIHCHSIVEV